MSPPFELVGDVLLVFEEVFFCPSLVAKSNNVVCFVEDLVGIFLGAIFVVGGFKVVFLGIGFATGLVVAGFLAGVFLASFLVEVFLA
ncbi:unnamed protein product, partial [marine sediment metagenome]